MRALAPVELWIGFVASALDASDYRENWLPRASSKSTSSRQEFMRLFDASQFLTAQNVDVDALAPHVDGKFAGAFIRATKPVGEVESRHSKPS